VDTFDAIRSDRPYRKGRDYTTACQIIASESGKQFEPRLVEAFLRVPEAEWNKLQNALKAEASPEPVKLKKAA
jgi:HD-GYP domain-containing protein (c-di-GMP phosphodiesterase class II)